MADKLVIKNSDGTYSYNGETYRVGDSGKYQQKIAGVWSSNPIAADSESALNDFINLPKQLKLKSGVTLTQSGEDWLDPNGVRYRKIGNSNTVTGDFGAKDAVWDSNTNSWTREGYTYGKTGWIQKTTNPDNSTKVTNLPYNTFVQNNLRSLQSRQEWVRNNADYLKSKGWTDADIAGYKGQGNLNLRLASQIAGAKDWADPEVARGREAGKTLRRLDSDARGLAVSTDATGKTLAPKVSMIPTSVVRKSVPELNTTFSSHIIDDTPISTAKRITYTDDQLRQLTASPEYIKHIFDYTPDEFNRLMAMKLEVPNQYSFKYATIDPALDAYGSFRKYLNTHKTGGKIDYQKIFK